MSAPSKAHARDRVPILYAHRGAAAEEPENTLPAFARALELGADALETDAHMTRDGHVVVGHDPGALRMTGVDWPIRNARLDEVRAWDAGYGFTDPAGGRPFKGRGYVMPTLDEMLRAFPGVRINVDAKQERPSMVARLLAVLRGAKAEDRVRIASFSARTLGEVRRAGYEGETGLAPSEVARAVLAPRAFLLHPRGRVLGQRAQLPLTAGPLRLDTRARIARLQALGLGVDFWTINDEPTARRLVSAGADGIMTDDPRALRALFRELRDATTSFPSARDARAADARTHERTTA